MTAFQVFKSSLQISGQRFVKVLRRQWPLLVTLHILGFALEQILDQSQNQALSIGRENWSVLLPIFAGSAITELIMTNLWLIVVVITVREDLKDHSLVQAFEAIVDYFNATAIESVRAFASVLRWVPALLFPAFVRYIQLIFVPYIVVGIPAYREGKIDALACSRAISRGYFWLLTISLVLTLSIPYFLGNLVHGGNDSIFQNPGPALVWGILTLFINLYCTLFLFSIFEKLATLSNEKWNSKIGGANAHI